MIHISIDDVRHLYFSCEPTAILNPNVYEILEVCSALSWATSHFIYIANCEEIARTIQDACVSYRDYTDRTCDTYACPNCPNYSWCTTLRGIAIEGVKLGY